MLSWLAYGIFTVLLLIVNIVLFIVLPAAKAGGQSPLQLTALTLEPTKSEVDPEFRIDLGPILSQLDINRATSQRTLDQLPAAVLAALNGSLNTQKGKLGEMIGYITLKAQYDRLIPLGSIVDFVGLRFPKGDDPGCIHFIDIKSGDSARLSKDQRYLKTLLTKGNIAFQTVKIDTVEGFSDEADHD